jgi:hypothetical protein
MTSCSFRLAAGTTSWKGETGVSILGTAKLPTHAVPSDTCSGRSDTPKADRYPAS